MVGGSGFSLEKYQTKNGCRTDLKQHEATLFMCLVPVKEFALLLGFGGNRCLQDVVAVVSVGGYFQLVVWNLKFVQLSRVITLIKACKDSKPTTRPPITIG